MDPTVASHVPPHIASRFDSYITSLMTSHVVPLMTSHVVFDGGVLRSLVFTFPSAPVGRYCLTILDYRGVIHTVAGTCDGHQVTVPLPPLTVGSEYSFMLHRESELVRPIPAPNEWYLRAEERFLFLIVPEPSEILSRAIALDVRWSYNVQKNCVRINVFSHMAVTPRVALLSTPGMESITLRRSSVGSFVFISFTPSGSGLHRLKVPRPPGYIYSLSRRYRGADVVEGDLIVDVVVPTANSPHPRAPCVDERSLKRIRLSPPVAKCP